MWSTVFGVDEAFKAQGASKSDKGTGMRSSRRQLPTSGERVMRIPTSCPFGLPTAGLDAPARILDGRSCQRHDSAQQNKDSRTAVPGSYNCEEKMLALC